MANLCASSLMLISRLWAWLPGGSLTGSLSRVVYTNSSLFAKEISSIFSPAFSIAFFALDSCPRPPSTTIRSGLFPKPSSPSLCLERRRFKTSSMLAKSFAPSTVLILKRRYCEASFSPSVKTTIDATLSVPLILLMS